LSAPQDERRIVAISGASGYLGTALVSHFRAAGWVVRSLARRAADEASRFRLGAAVDPLLLHGVHALVHAAYDFSLVRVADIVRVNVEGSERLFEAAALSGVRRIVHVSSISAFPACRSRYGRAKLATERSAQAQGAMVLRPALLWGDPPGGTFGSMVARVRDAQIVPLIGDGSAVQYLLHRDDLSRVIVDYCGGTLDRTDEPLTIAHSRPWTLRELLASMVAEGATTRFVPVPWQLVWGGLRVAEAVGLRLSFRSDSVVSLVHQNPSPDFTLQSRLRIECRAYGAAGRPASQR